MAHNSADQGLLSSESHSISIKTAEVQAEGIPINRKQDETIETKRDTMKTLSDFSLASKIKRHLGKQNKTAQLENRGKHRIVVLLFCAALAFLFIELYFWLQ